MAPKHRQTDSDDEDLLEAVMSKYKDRAKDKDEDSIKAAEDWSRFQGMSEAETKHFGGSESTTHLVKGLDTALLQRQREQLAAQSSSLEVHEQPQVPVDDSGPKTELGRAIQRVLFNPNKPHPHNVHFKEQLAALERMMSRLPPDQDMPGSTSFARQIRYSFRDDVDYPVLLMKSREEIEDEPARGARVRRDPELISAIAEAVDRKRPKKKKKDEVRVSKSVEEDDFDMFGGFTSSVSLQQPEKSTEPLFADMTGAESAPSDDLHKLQQTLLERQTKETTGTKRSLAEEDELPAFGEKLDLSKYATAEEKEAKKKKTSDKQLFNQVMKRVNERDKS